VIPLPENLTGDSQNVMDAADKMQQTPTSPGKSRNGAINALQKEDLPIHGWYRFVLSFPPHLVRQYTNQLVMEK
jgi:hypothetical protein